MKIGFIGLGIMGKPMCGHLIAAGHELSVFDVVGVPEEIKAKATVCANAKEVAEKGDVIIVMVPDTPHVNAVLFGENGVAQGLSKGKIVVDMSSISPVETKKFAAKINELGCDYLDGPVSGGQVGAEQQSLTIMVGGPQSAFDTVKPLFELMGKNITLVGGNGDGQTAKVANPDHRRLEHSGVRRSPGLRLQGGCRSGEGASGPDGRFRFVAHPRAPRRADDQADLQSGLPHQSAPEGPEQRTEQRPRPWRVAAEHRDCPGNVQFRRRAVKAARRWTTRP